MAVFPLSVSPALSLFTGLLPSGFGLGMGSSEEEQACMRLTPKMAKATVGHVVFKNSLLFFMVFYFKDKSQKSVNKAFSVIFSVHLLSYLTFLEPFLSLVFFNITSHFHLK